MAKAAKRRLSNDPALAVERGQVVDFQAYRFDPLAYIADKLKWTPWQGSQARPGQWEIVEAYARVLRQLHERMAYEAGELRADELETWTPGETIQNRLRIESGHTVGKTKLCSALVSHFFDCFAPSIIYTFAPSGDQVKNLLWKEIKTDRRRNALPGRILDLRLEHADDHFAIGRATSDAHGKGSERIHGQHGRYLMFVVDEAEGVAPFVFDAIDGMASGGICVVLYVANPKTRLSRFWKLRTLSTVQNFRISCFWHPNVLEGRDVVPGAVRREYVLEMTEKHAEPVAEHDEDRLTYALPWPVVKDGVTYPPGQVWAPDSEFMFRVMGVAPANMSDDTFVSVGLYEAAKARELKPGQRVDLVVYGVDCARYGKDRGAIYRRWAGTLTRIASLQGKGGESYKAAIVADLKKLREGGAPITEVQVRVDGTGGFGSGVVDLFKADVLFRDSFQTFHLLEVNFGWEAHDKKAYANCVTEMYGHAAAQLRDVRLVNPPAELEEDLTERTFGFVTIDGYDVRALQPKEKFRKDKHRSPDDGDAAVLCLAPVSIFRPKAYVVTWSQLKAGR